MKYMIACIVLWVAILTIAIVLGIKERDRCREAGGAIVYGVCIDRRVIR